MGKFVIEENPQVTYWKEECERERLKLSEWARLYREKSDFFNKWMRDREKMIDCLKENEGFLRRRRDRLESMMRDFDALPWWKKMFFKFDV